MKRRLSAVLIVLGTVLLALALDLWLMNRQEAGHARQFAAQVMPKVVLISCGKDNDYGHPHQGPMARFQMLGAQILRTDEQGILLVAPAADGQSLNTWVSGADEAA